ncbi:MAG: DUF2442 domain-containing protein [Gammaproteobacteria bacterium]|nr:DUF2442 domain-containing protein [Gammaproteobacteria bacterium]
MIKHIDKARYLDDFRIWLEFEDGVSGEVDLSQDLDGPIFEPLRRVEYFRSFRLHPELKTLVWPNGADFAPEFLRDKLTMHA